jgi:hypothetical protein
MLSGLTRRSGTSGTAGSAGTAVHPIGAGARRVHLQHDWVALLGEVIEVRLADRTVRTGRVDGVTPDGAILWIEAHGAEPRTMCERHEGFTAWIEYKWETVPSSI